MSTDELQPTERRCTRCNIPSPSHSQSSDNGGVSLNADGVCIVCEAFHAEYGFYPDTKQTSLS
jgi:hypothetical protein